MAEETDKASVFISYSRLDLEFVEVVDAALRLAGFNPMLDQRSISPGDNWTIRLGALIRNVDAVVFVLTPSALQSEMCAWEVQEALNVGKRIIPVLPGSLGDAKPRSELAALEYIYCYTEPSQRGSGYGPGLIALAEALETDLDWLREHTRYLQQALSWEAKKRARERLLSGDDIEDAKEWASSRPAKAPEPTALQLEFIKESEAEDTRQKNKIAEEQAKKKIEQAEKEKALAEKENALAEKEVAQNRAAEAQKRELAEAHKSKVRARSFLVAVTMLLGLVTLAAAWAILQQTFAQMRLADAQSDSRPVASASQALATLGDRDQQVHDLAHIQSIIQNWISARMAGVVSIAYQVPNELRLLSDDVLGRAVPNLHQLKIFENAGSYAEFGPLGKSIITTSESAKPSVYDAHSWALINSPLDFRSSYVTLSADERLVFARLEKSAALMDATTGKQLDRFPRDGQTSADLDLTSAALSPDGRMVVTASISSREDLPPDVKKPTVQIWDVGDATKPARALGGGFGEGHSKRVNLVAFSSDGKLIVTASEDKTAIIWNAVTGEPQQTIPLLDKALYAAFDPKGERIVVVWDDNAAQVFDVATGRPTGGQLSHDRRINSAVFNPQGTQIVTASDDGTARLWDAWLGTPIATLAGHEAVVNFAGFSPDGTKVVTSSEDNTVRIWDNTRVRPYRTLAKCGELAGHRDIVWSIALSTDKKHAITASNDSSALIWDTDKGQPIGDPILHSNPVTSVELNSTGDSIVTASTHDGTQIWDAATGKWKNGFHDANATYAAFSPDGRFIATAYEYRKVRIWSAPANDATSEPRYLEAPEPIVLNAPDAEPENKKKVWSVQFSPDSRRIVTASDDGTARILDVATRQVTGVLKHPKEVYFASFSPDGRKIVTASEDNLAYVWDVLNSPPKISLRLSGHRGWVNSAVFSKDGTRIVTASKDHTARVWDAVTGETIAVLSGHGGTVEFASFSADGKMVFTASDDKTGRLWNISGIPPGDIASVAATLLDGDARPGGLSDDLGLDHPVCNVNLPAAFPTVPATIPPPH